MEERTVLALWWQSQSLNKQKVIKLFESVLNMMQTIFLAAVGLSMWAMSYFMLHHVKVKHFRNRLNFL